MSDDLQVRGGTAGTAAQLEHLDSAVVRLHASAASLADVRDSLGLGRGLLAGLTGLLEHPGAVLALEGDLLAVDVDLAVGTDLAEQLADGVASAVGAYRTAEETAANLWLAVPLGVGVPALVAGELAVTALGGSLPELDALVRTLSGGEGSGAPAGAADAPGAGLGGLTGTLQQPAAPPGARMSDEALVGALTAAPAGAVPAAGPTAGGVANVHLGDPAAALMAVVGASVAGTGALLVGRPASPTIARQLVEEGTALGVVDSTRVTTTQVPVSGAVAAAGPPRGAGDLVRRVRQTADTGTGPAGRVRVEVVTGADGRRRAIVYMPGVQDWATDSRNPMSGGSALRAEAGMTSAYTDLVVRALDEAGVTKDEPVLLAGHSLGGIAAAQVAGDPAVLDRFTVTAVVTAGSPVGEAGIPSDVTVLSLEHDNDLVPRLDLTANTDAPNVTTVTATAPTWSPGNAHGSDLYADLADRVDGSADPSLVAWREEVAPFLAGAGATSVVTEVAGRTVDPTPHG